MSNGYEYIAESLSATSSIDAVVIAAMITGAVAIIGSLVNSIVSYRIKRKEYEHNEAREKQKKMITPYNKLVSMIFEMLNLSKQNYTMDDSELFKKMAEFNIAVILYGSNEVIAKWGNYRVNLIDPEKPPEEKILKLEELLYVIREDLGFEKKGMREGDILNLFINDTEKLTSGDDMRECARD
ncbi:MAG: hypothetical protein FWC96_03860 [Oscillospiraceae bacterium]|nr:hypothetical protein [Oscillospiraceae bacterium]